MNKIVCLCNKYTVFKPFICYTNKRFGGFPAAFPNLRHLSKQKAMDAGMKTDENLSNKRGFKQISNEQIDAFCYSPRSNGRP